MRFVLICLAAVLLSGCGYIAGKRVDFGSDFSKYPYDLEISQLAGKTFYISNYEDYERLIQLKKDLRELYNSPTPTKSLQAGCAKDILQITNQYDSGILGFLFTGKINSSEYPQSSSNNPKEADWHIDWRDPFTRGFWIIVGVSVLISIAIWILKGRDLGPLKKNDKK